MDWPRSDESELNTAHASEHVYADEKPFDCLARALKSGLALQDVMPYRSLFGHRNERAKLVTVHDRATETTQSRFVSARFHALRPHR